MTSSKTARPKAKEAKNRPVHEVRFGRIRAAIWLNESDNGPYYNVTIARLYKDGEQWKDSTSFGRDDLPLIAKVCDLAHTWIYQQAADRSSSNGDDDHGGNDDNGSDS